MLFSLFAITIDRVRLWCPAHRRNVVVSYLSETDPALSAATTQVRSTAGLSTPPRGTSRDEAILIKLFIHALE